MGKHIPTLKTVTKVAPKLEADFGIPAAEWIAACNLSRALRSYNPSDGKPPRLQCRQGHNMPAGGWPPMGNCPACDDTSRKRALAAYRKRNASLCCTACGRQGVDKAGLCSACYHSKDRYGDPSVTRAPRNGQGRSGYRGVVCIGHLVATPWRATVTHDKRTYTLGYFATAEQAARAYDAKARELLGGKARLNFPDVALSAAAETEGDVLGN